MSSGVKTPDKAKSSCSTTRFVSRSARYMSSMSMSVWGGFLMKQPPITGQ